MSLHRSLIPPLIISLVLIVISALNVWLILQAQLSKTITLLVFVTELLVLLTGVWIGYALIQLRLFRPIRMLEDQFRVLAHSDAPHRFSLPADHYLGQLPERAQELGQALNRERHQTARTIASATTRIEQRKARLEAILHDLTEGVVVCSSNHQVVLFNQAARLQLREAGTLGLHRNILSFFHEDLIKQKLDQLSYRYTDEARREISEFECALSGNGHVLCLRMTLIIDPEHGCNGYVLCLSGNTGPTPRSKTYERSVLADRPEFYDFSLLDREVPVQYPERPLIDLTYVVFDTETTGLQPSRGDEMVQISGVRIVNGRVLEEEIFDRLIDPGMPIPPSSIRYHGITDEMVKDAPTADVVLREFHRFVDGAVLVAHNAAFDMKFLNLKEQQSGVSFNLPVLDTLLLSFVLQPSHSAHSLDAIAARFGVAIPPGARHTALGDARCTAQIFLRMLGTLPHQGITTLRGAMRASNQVLEMKKFQEQF